MLCSFGANCPEFGVNTENEFTKFLNEAKEIFALDVIEHVYQKCETDSLYGQMYARVKNVRDVRSSQNKQLSETLLMKTGILFFNDLPGDVGDVVSYDQVLKESKVNKSL
jgi:hypothetical protein